MTEPGPAHPLSIPPGLPFSGERGYIQAKKWVETDKDGRSSKDLEQQKGAGKAKPQERVKGDRSYLKASWICTTLACIRHVSSSPGKAEFEEKAWVKWRVR